MSGSSFGPLGGALAWAWARASGELWRLGRPEKSTSDRPAVSCGPPTGPRHTATATASLIWSKARGWSWLGWFPLVLVMDGCWTLPLLLWFSCATSVSQFDDAAGSDVHSLFPVAVICGHLSVLPTAIKCKIALCVAHYRYQSFQKTIYTLLLLRLSKILPINMSPLTYHNLILLF